MKKLKMNTARYPEDVERIQKVLREFDYEATLEQCEKLWGNYSDSMCAGWMSLPEEPSDIYWAIKPYIVN